MKKTLTKADIVEAIYEETDKNRVDVKNVVEKLLDIMKGAIKKDRALLISGFGKFECYDKASRKGRNPKTDETITLPPRKVMVFRLSRKFRAELTSRSPDRETAAPPPSASPAAAFRLLRLRQRTSVGLTCVWTCACAHEARTWSSPVAGGGGMQNALDSACRPHGAALNHS